MKIKFRHTVKAHHLIFIYTLIIALHQILEEFLTSREFTSFFFERVLKNTILYTGVGFLIKHNFKFAAIIFILPIIVQPIYFYDLLINEKPIDNLSNKIFELFNFFFSLIIILSIFIKPNK